LIKAYDKVNRNALWEVLKKLVVPPNMVGLIRGIRVGVMAQLREGGLLSEEFAVMMSLKQTIWHSYQGRWRDCE
jgi:hypothetical protein